MSLGTNTTSLEEVKRMAEALNDAATFTVTDIEGGHRVTIVNYQGTQYFDVLDGQNGEPGTTPDKGTDYWTAADKQELLNEMATQYPVVHSGTSAPASSLGKNGDLYLRVY